MPLSTDSGDMPNFWFPFAAANKRLQDGGWARQVTVNELPIAKNLAAVDMYLTAGAIRELHWHLPAEWAFVLYGNARITGFDQDGRSFVADVKAGDLWNFPSGIPHSIQGLDPDGIEFLLVFDDGAFSEFDTFLVTQWMAHTPVDVLAKNFQLPASTFNPIPLHEKYIFQAPVPGPLSADQKSAMGPQGATPESFSYALLAKAPDFTSPYGEARIADSKKFPMSSTVAAAHVIVRPGAMRELHWHPNADEWQYYIAGSGRMGVFAAGNKVHTKDFMPAMSATCRGRWGTMSILAHMTDISRSIPEQLLRLDFIRAVADYLPPELVQAHFNFSTDTMKAMSKGDARVVVGV